ncbi:peptidoglycan DD-metalloendopeptidase family protein [Ruminococcus flavefaciens]|uniref:peptidoglycan DD-metalloendopeptidase family protein n=1 Tax=Ruminococcus flavefaciens TaxID=1265 RepID=UPI0026F07174|nr:peptidoglycan DD-metalloendopeptidase family protein [Ruminococcus flavefaciens]MDD7516524.1 peptidoglycan DD-metalloendopeptidase family protein [Ruminococcus flavefaciens]MDY5691708.1 peptidoglycan DD-metalloendopeptidase family protein [Ruminococcus flavefaciens]
MKNIIRRAAAFLLSIAVIFTIQMWFVPTLNAKAAVYGVWPTEPKYKNITTYFDPARNTYDNSAHHNAVDIEAAGGSNIYAVYGGEVISADWKDAYGNMVILYHADLGVYTFYAHASQMNVSAGAKVKQGDVIAKVGSTGQSSGNHLHFGVCDKLVGAFPARTYYDPMTYFVFSDNTGGEQLQTPAAECDCSEDYAGLYTTKNVVTYLNIRSGHNTSSSVIGQIPANAEFTVTKGNGEWAHVEYKGTKGYASMAYMQIKEEVKSDMKIDNATAPEGTLEAGKPFSLKGVITSNLNITKVYGGVYFRDGEATSQCAEAAPNAVKYDLSTYFDKNIIFNALYEGEYTYKIVAEDSSGETYTLISSDFIISSDIYSGVMGDLNGDGSLSVADIVVLQDHILNKEGEFTKKQYLASDLNKDSSVDIFDLIELRKAVIAVTE